jgi:hypothetical protein
MRLFIRRQGPGAHKHGYGGHPSGRRTADSGGRRAGGHPGGRRTGEHPGGRYATGGHEWLHACAMGYGSPYPLPGCKVGSRPNPKSPGGRSPAAPVAKNQIPLPRSPLVGWFGRSGPNSGQRSHKRTTAPPRKVPFLSRSQGHLG